jgi:hypothetical protein
MRGAWCPTPRPTWRPQQTIRQAYNHPQNFGFEKEKEQLREWMTVAREIDPHGGIELNPI